jgi:hypothetical protein
MKRGQGLCLHRRGALGRTTSCVQRASKGGRGDFLCLAEGRKLWEKEWEPACGRNRGGGRWGEGEWRRGLMAAGALA